MTKIVITGGHHNAALVVAQLLQKEGVKIIWLGHRHASRGDTRDSAEYTEVTAAAIPFHDLQAGRFTVSLQETIRLPWGLLQAWRLLRQTKPDAILSFGGYLGAAAALPAALLGLPVYLHEQTRSAGKANKLVGMIAKRVYLTWPDSAAHFPKGKTKVIGLPLRASILGSTKRPLFARRKPTLLVMGGKQGAHVINQFIFTHLSELLRHFNLVHQTGTNSRTQDYERALALQNTLMSLSDSYLPLGYIGEGEIGSYLRSADLYLGRSGAHTTYELALLGLPAILIPFMYTHDHEQQQNAHYLESIGLGVSMSESTLSLKRVLAAVQQLKTQTPIPVKLAENAAARLAQDLLKDVRGH